MLCLKIYIVVSRTLGIIFPNGIINTAIITKLCHFQIFKFKYSNLLLLLLLSDILILTSIIIMTLLIAVVYDNILVKLILNSGKVLL